MKIQFWPFSKLTEKYKKLGETIYTKKVSHFLKLSNAISFVEFGLTVKNLGRKYELGGTYTIF